MLIAIFALLYVVGFKHKNNIDKYHIYEDKLIVAARSYVKSNNLYPKKGSKVSVKIGDLKNQGYIDKKDVVSGCTGTIIVKYDKFIDYIPNIKCKYYKSESK